MAVKKGYKQTEVGVIPEDWAVTSVGHEFTIQLGKMLDSEKNIGVPKPFLGNRCVQWGRFDLSDLGTIKLTSSDLKRFRLQEGDLLVCEGGEIGRAAIWHSEIDECYFQKALHRLQPRKSYAVRFMLYTLEHLATIGFLSNYVTKTSIAHLPKDKFETVPLPLPPLTEQEAIAGALSDADAWIESLEQLIAKKRQIKQGAMQELLTGKRRLPGFSGKWETKRLGDLGRCQRGVSYNPLIDLFSGDTNSSVRLLRSNNVQDAKIVYSDMQFVASSRVSSEQYLQKNDVLICMANGSRDLVGKAGRYCEERGSAYTFGAFMGGFRPASEMANPAFCFYLFQTAEYRQHIAILLAGSSINNLTPDNLESHLVVVPNTMVEQAAIATVLSDMDTELESLESKLAKAREAKQGMMQELLTGRIRLV